MSGFASHIELTLLKQTAVWQDVDALLSTAAEHHYYGVCISPYFVKQAARHIRKKGWKQKLVTVIGFPMGYNSVSAKVEEIKKAVMEGADELDIVVNLSAFLSKDMAVLKNDIQSTITACHLLNKKSKMILETGALSEKDVIKLADICVAADTDFIKTSTGYYETGAELNKVEMLRNHLPKKVRIKASGGIKSREMAQQFLDAGADRIGTSSIL
ncbi:MAG: deoxyribose-phosphate aldolase [Bacteroidetes bacterium]|nr:deoxyribose-phosphate aldolase [Bacteroidota bacterium]